MIDRGVHGTQSRTIPLASESVHGLPLDWAEGKKMLRRNRKRSDALLATQNVHGIPTAWKELDLSE